MPSPLLGIKTLATAQSNKVGDINTDFIHVEDASNRFLQITVTGDTTVTADEFGHSIGFELVGSPIAFDLNVPATARLFLVDNDTGVTATVQVVGGGGTGGTVLDGEIKWVKSDGTDLKVIP